ncbi:hypothetical protein GYMLUDRAFT_235904 [Collybiopsis luxurians FD-317 M1]|nr:hypothetical protein GYMLUDRAFT_235904 [Collybiopsis luxurians FD-317 M1]
MDDIRLVEKTFSNGGAPILQTHSWSFYRYSPHSSTTQTHVVVVGCWNTPVADILQISSSTQFLNVITHSHAYSLYPFALFGYTPSIAIKPYQYHPNEKEIRERIRYFANPAGDANSVARLPSAHSACTFNGPLSFLVPRRFDDKYTWVIKLPTKLTQNMQDNISLNSFYLSYQVNWITPMFTTIMPPGDAFKYCITHDLYAAFGPTQMKVSDSDYCFAFLEEFKRNALSIENISITTETHDTYVLVKQVIKEMDIVVSKSNVRGFDAYTVSVLFGFLHLVRKSVHRLAISRIFITSDFLHRPSIFITVGINLYKGQQPSVLCDFNFLLDILFEEQLFVFWDIGDILL